MVLPNNRLRALLPAAALALCACPHRLQLGPQGLADSPEVLLSRLDEAEAKVQGVKGEARLKVDAPGRSGVVTLFVAARAPASIHLEQLDFFGRPQGILVTDGARFLVFDGQAGRWFQGPASPANLARYLPLVMPPADFAALLLGKAPRLRPFERASLSLDEGKGAYLLTLERGAQAERLWVRPPEHRVDALELGGPSPLSITFSSWTTKGEARWPSVVALTQPDAALQAELRWKDVEVNGELDPSLFDLAPPEGTSATEVDAEGREKGQ